MVGELKISPKEALDFDIDDFLYWADRLDDYIAWVNASGQK